MLEPLKMQAVVRTTDYECSSTDSNEWRLEARRSALQLKHASLNAEILFEQQASSPDTSKLDRLVCERLTIEDQLYRLEAAQ